MEQEKLLIDFDESAYKHKTGRLKLFIQFFEQAIETYNSFNIGAFKPEDFENLICRTETFVNEKLFQSKDFSAVESLGLSKSKLMDLLEKPAGYNSLFETIAKIERLHNTNNISDEFYISGLKQQLTFYVFDKNDKIKISDSILESLKSSFETYIDTEKAKDVYNFANEVIKLQKKFNIPVSHRSENARFIENLIDFDRGRPVVNIQLVKQINRNALGLS